MVVAGINPPVVADKHIQESITRLWQNSTSRSFLAMQLAKYSHQEPSLTPVVLALVDSLEGDERQDRERILARLDQDPHEALPRGFDWEAAQHPREHNQPAVEPGLAVRVDPELGRLALGLEKTLEFRLWSIARHYFGQPGWVDKQDLFQTLHTTLPCSYRNFNRWLAAGKGLFWGVADNGRVFLRSYLRITADLTALALQTNPDLVATNLPGVPDMYLPIKDHLGDFRAWIYAGWLASRSGPTIARETLCGLFACDEDTLRSWEETLGEQNLTVVANYAQTALDPKNDGAVLDYLPAHAFETITSRSEKRYRWRLPNRYQPRTIREHAHKGQSRKARTIAALIAWGQPVEPCAGDKEKLPFDRTHRVPRRYFETAKKLRKFLERRARRDQEMGKLPRYVYRGEDRYGHGIYELSLDGEAQTTAMERASFKKEYAWRKGLEMRIRNWQTAMAQAG